MQENDGTVVGDEAPSEPLSSQRKDGKDGKDGDSSWLPEGWTVEVKYRKAGSSGGNKYKVIEEYFFFANHVLNIEIKRIFFNSFFIFIFLVL